MSITVPLEGFGGGARLNFKVVGNPQPANPNENTIWIDTDVEITSWIFSATQPEQATEGMVWICIGASGNTEFNALKKNDLIVYPICAKQYVGGALVDKQTEIYKDDAWNPVLREQHIFTNSKGAIVPLSTSVQASLFNVTITNDHIYGYGYAHSDSNVNVAVYTESEKDLLGYTTLCFDIEITTGTITFGVSRDPMIANNPANMPFIAKQQVGTCSRKTISIDISDVDKGYIGACGCGNYYIYNWWYE